MFELRKKPPEPAITYEIEKELEKTTEAEIGELISVMPARFRKAKKMKPSGSRPPIEAPVKKPKGKFFVILIIVVIILAVIGGGWGFYSWAKNYLKEPKPLTPPVTQPTRPQPPPEAPELRLTAEIVDSFGQEVISTAELFFPTGALEIGKIFELTGIFQPAEAPTSTYQYLGGIYKISPEIPILKKPVNLQITYASKLTDSSWEREIKFGYLKDNLWTILPASIDINTNTVSTTLDIIPADTFALIVEQTKIAPTIEEIQIAPQIFSSSDQDNDGLTDVEEQIYSTNPNNPDTDADGQTDGQEIINLFDPTHLEATLSLSGLIKVFTNQKWSYSFFYPSNWLTKPLPETDMTQIIVITNTGEFFEISIEENPQNLTPREWYLKQATQVDPEQVKEIVFATLTAVWSPDRLNLYIGRDDKIYILTYNLGTEGEANFKTTFKMLIKSFQFIEKIEEEIVVPEGKFLGTRPDGSLIKYPDAPAVYLLENGRKRPIKSEAVYERLGYDKWDIVEIPLEEWYPDGVMIE